MSRLRITALTAALIFVTGPAFALCNPGTPHCIKVGAGSRLATLKKKLSNPGTLGSGDVTCKNSSLCGIDTGDGTSPGYLPRHAGQPSHTTPVHVTMHVGRRR